MWKDTVGQEVNTGDVVAYVPAGCHNTLDIGVLISVSAKGNATICSGIYGGKPCNEVRRAGFMKVHNIKTLSDKHQDTIELIKSYYGNTRD